jgi:hypothetical protein
MTAFETNLDDALAAWPIRGLARRFPAKDLETLKTLLQEYAYRLPGDLPHGVKFVRAGGPDDDFYMATDGRGSFWFRHVVYQGFNSQRDLFGAMACCATRQPMTQEQEYALESLWHEIWHNRQKSITALNKLTSAHPVRRFAETLNQAVARLTYPTFVERLGGRSAHQQWVIEHGYGYAETVQRLWQVIRQCGLEPLNIAGELSSVNMTEDLSLATRQLAKILAKRSGLNEQAIYAALETLSADERLFISI